MATPTLGPLSAPSVFAPSEGAQLATAVGQFPQIMQQEQLQNAQTQNQLAQADDQTLARIAQYGQTNPQFLSNPQVKGTVEQIFRRRNLPVPTGADGNIDIEALLPRKDPTQMTSDELKYFQGLPAATRKSTVEAAGYNAGLFPPDFFTSQPVQPVYAGEQTALISALPRMFAQIADPKNGGPEVVESIVRNLAPIYQRVLGVDPAQMFDDPNLMSALTQRANVETQRLVELGIVHPQDQDKVAEQRVQEQVATLKEHMRLDDSTIQHRLAQEQQANQRLSLDWSRENRLATQQNTLLGLKAQQLQASIHHLNNLVGTQGISQFDAATKPFLAQYKAATDNYSKMLAELELDPKKGATVIGKQPDGTDLTISQALINQQNQIKSLQPTYDKITQMAAQKGLQTVNAVLPAGFKATNNGATTQEWTAGNGSKITMTSNDGGKTFTDGKGHWYDANKNPVAPPSGTP